MENDVTRDHRHSMAGAVKEYRETLGDNPSADHEKEVARAVAEKHGVTQKDIREQAESGA